MTTAAPLVSVVTPVYNAQQFLAECIESVLRQTHQNWEYVIVNNCSTDRSLEIAQAYAQKDARIRLHDNAQFITSLQNQNHALRLISPDSEYCKIVHADDWLFPRCLEEMVGIVQACPSVGVVGAYRLSGKELNLGGLDYHEVCVSGREICRRSLLGEFYVFGSPSSLLIRADLVRRRQAFYAESHLWADTEVCYEILQDSDFGFVHQLLTYTRRHPGAASSFAQRFNTYRLAELALLIRFGRTFLTSTEYERRVEVVLRRYYRFVVRSAVARKERAFWAFHRDGLRALGLRPSPLRFLEASTGLALGLLARPFRSLAAAVQSGQGR